MRKPLFRYARPILPRASALICCALLAVSAQAGWIDEFELDWDPTIDIDDLDVAKLPRTSVSIVPFTDTREQPQRIGEARLYQLGAGGVDDSGRRAITTEENVAAWSTRYFAKVLDDAGMKLAKRGGAVQLHGEVVQFLASKGPDYNGDIAFRITLQDGEHVLWRGVVSGWARLANEDWDEGDEDEYNEIISDALVRAVASLVAYPRFREVLANPSAPLAPAAVPAEADADH